MVCPEPPQPSKKWELRELIWIPVEADGVWYLGLSAASYKNLAYNWNALVVSLEEENLEGRHYANCIRRHNEDQNERYGDKD